MGLIRFFLALSVLLVHSNPVFGLQLLPGSLAVQCFYIISGFYMAFIFNEKYTLLSRPLFHFFSNRILRIYPLYLLIILMTLALSLVFGISLNDFGKLQFYSNELNQVPQSAGSLLVLFLSNITLIGQDVVTFFSLNSHGGLYFNGLQSEITLQEYLLIPIAWTISVELFFYFLTPWIAKRKVFFVLGALCAVIALRAALFFFFNVSGEFAIYRFAPTELFWFLLGIVGYKIDFLKGKVAQAMSVFLFFLMITVFFTYRFFQIDWIVLILIFLTTPAIFYKFFRNKIDRYLGELTYPLYISHYFFLLIVSANRFPKNWGIGIPLFLMTVAFSVVVHRYFVRPIDRWREKRLRLGEVQS
jgi:peptidoglycan/LPS O-acetylase OafA/YrhL